MKISNLMNVFMVALFAICGVIYIFYGLQDFRSGILIGITSPPPRLLFGIVLELFAIFTTLVFFRYKKV